MDVPVRTSRRRTRRRITRKARTLMQVAGWLGLAVALVFAVVGVLQTNRQMLFTAAGALLGSGALLTAGVAISSEASEPRHSTPGTRGSDAGSRSAMALVMVLVLLATIASVTICSQVSVGYALKRAKARWGKTELRMAAGDALWRFLRASAGQRAASGAKDGWASSSQSATPRGTETNMRVISQEELGLSPLLAAVGKTGDGRLYVIEATAGAAEKIEKVYCFVRRPPNGSVEVLGWLENN